MLSAVEGGAMGRILVAEDEGSLAELVRINLEDDGHEVVIAADGRFALQALMEQGPFDVVVLDLMMPWADGFDVLRNLGPRRPKIVVLTAREDDYSRDRAEDLGVDAYLTKPYDPAELADRVRELAG
jgi:DNA-binding response OmpR family regulator